MQPEKGDRGLWYVGTVGFATKEEAQAYIDRGYKHFGAPTPPHSQGTKTGSSKAGSYTLVGIVLVATVAYGGFRLVTGNTAKPQVSNAQCISGSQITGVTYRPIRDAELHASWEKGSKKLINEKATAYSGSIQYQQIDGSMKVIEECTYMDASYVRVLEPDYLNQRAGWVSEHDLKEKDDPNDPYEGKIARYIFDDFVPEMFEGDGAKFKPEKKQINNEKILAAKKVIDSGQCEYVAGSLFFAAESTTSRRKYIVDCSNKQRFTLLSSDLISPTARIVSDSEQAVSQSQAAKICKNLVISQAQIPTSVTFDDLIGSSYYKAPSSGNVRYIIDFEARNAIGATQKLKAICTIGINDSRDIEIRAR